MIRLFQIAVFSFLLFHLSGCNAPDENQPIWQNIKIGDLAPSRPDKRPGSQALKTINFNVYIFEMPAENVTALDDIWPILHTSPFRFNDYDAFKANSFSVALGQTHIWNKLNHLLYAAGAKTMQTVSLLLLNAQSNDLTVARLYAEQTIFHISSDGSMEGATIGPGKLALRIKAEKIPGLRGLCSVNVQPVFTSSLRSLIPQLPARAEPGELPFTSAAFALKMSPGDFFFLGPEKYVDDRITLPSYFFSRPAPSPGVRMFLIPSSGDTQEPQPYFGPVVRAYLVLCTAISD